jgi:hypothetical protein
VSAISLSARRAPGTLPSMRTPASLALLLGLMVGRPGLAAGPRDPGVEELVEAAVSASGPARVDALRAISQRKVRAARRLLPGLDALHLGDREARALVEALAAAPEPATPPALLRWLTREVDVAGGAPLPAGALATPDIEATLLRALPLAGRARPGPGLALLLATLSSHPSDAVAQAALEVAASRADLPLRTHLSAWTAALVRPVLLGRALEVLARGRDRRAIEPILADAERFAEANPMQRGAPEHAAALRKITGARLGDDPAAWRRWLRGRGRR